MAPTPDADALHPNVPGSLQHAGEVDEFDAALVRGARPHDGLSDELSQLGDAGGAEQVGLPEDEEDSSGRSPEPPGPPAARSRRASPAPRRGGNRALAFLRASWAELQRVQWPDRRQVAQATAVVLGFVVVAGVYLGAADWVAQKVVNFVL